MLMTSSKAKYSSTRLTTFSLELFQWLQLQLRWLLALYDVHEKLTTSICLILLALSLVHMMLISSVSTAPLSKNLLRMTSLDSAANFEIQQTWWQWRCCLALPCLAFQSNKRNQLWCFSFATPPHHTPNFFFFSSSANPGIQRYQSLISILPPHFISKGLKSARATTWSQLSWDPATSNQQNGKTPSSSQPFEFILAT